MLTLTEYGIDKVNNDNGKPKFKRRKSLVLFQENIDKYNKADVNLNKRDLRIIAKNPHHFDSPIGGWIKRTFDVAIASATIALMLPIFIITMLVILVTSGRPIFVVQQRQGFNGKPFGCLRFRTSVDEFDGHNCCNLSDGSTLPHVSEKNGGLEGQANTSWIGNLLRDSSLDELPQLFNILRGEMSCIGPRPIVSSEAHRYGSYVADYIKAKPGLTGMWQVNECRSRSYAYRINCDRYYIRRWSLWLDFMILFRTVPTLLRFDGRSERPKKFVY